MSLLVNAAITWNVLTNYSYSLTIGKRKNMDKILLKFRTEDFDHLAGMQYSTDVDFKLPRNKYRGKNLIPALLDGKLDGRIIEKSAQWNRIQSRLDLIMNLEEILDSDFIIYKFDSKKLPFHSDIKASFCIYSEEYKKGVFLFVDQDDKCCFCKSVFTRDEARDYRSGQSKWTVLKKIKIIENTEHLLYAKGSFKPELSGLG